MEKEEYLRQVNELIGQGVPAEEAHYRVLTNELEEANKKYHSISGLWPNDDPNRPNLAFDGFVKDRNLKIPKGAKILAFKNDSDNEKAPTYRLVWTRS